MRHDIHINRALGLANTLIDKYQFPLGAVLVSGGRIISLGWNRLENGVHAEMKAIMRARKSSLNKAILYVARARRDQAHGCAKPCAKCEALIKKSGIKMVIYTTDDIAHPYDIWRVYA